MSPEEDEVFEEMVQLGQNLVHEDVKWHDRWLNVPTTTSLTFEEHVDEVFAELKHILLEKQRAYGPKAITDSPGGAEVGIRVRLHDKISRLDHLIENNTEPRWESVEDTLGDAANYLIIWILLRRKQWPGVA